MPRDPSGLESTVWGSPATSLAHSSPSACPHPQPSVPPVSPRVAHPPTPSQACLLCCLHSLTVSPSMEAGLVELPGWGGVSGSSEP